MITGSRIRADEKGLAQVVILLFVVLLLAAGTFFFLVLTRPRSEPRELSGVGSTRTVVTAEASYRQSKWKTPTGELIGYSAGLHELGCENGNEGMLTSTSACLIDDVLANATSPATPKSGYYFVYKTTNGGAGFTVSANPVLPDDGSRYFFSDQTGLIRFSQNRPATINDPPLQ
jgi:hypothetical protein